MSYVVAQYIECSCECHAVWLYLGQSGFFDISGAVCGVLLSHFVFWTRTNEHSLKRVHRPLNLDWVIPYWGLLHTGSILMNKYHGLATETL